MGHHNTRCFSYCFSSQLSCRFWFGIKFSKCSPRMHLLQKLWEKIAIREQRGLSESDKKADMSRRTHIRTDVVFAVASAVLINSPPGSSLEATDVRRRSAMLHSIQPSPRLSCGRLFDAAATKRNVLAQKERSNAASSRGVILAWFFLNSLFFVWKQAFPVIHKILRLCLRIREDYLLSCSLGHWCLGIDLQVHERSFN